MQTPRNRIKLIKIVAYLFSFILFLLVALILVLPGFLKKNDIYVESLSFHFPGSLSIKQFELNKPNFKLKIEQLELDLEIKSLLNGKFIGEGLHADGVNIVVKPTDAPFSYSVIPYISFNTVHFQNAFLTVLNTPDTISMSFPDLKISQLLWNDSILVNELVYSHGLYRTVNYSKKESSGKASPIHVPNGVPKFHVKHLQLVKNAVLVQTKNKTTQVNEIDLDLSGWNTGPGADLTLKQLSFVLQDTLSIQVRSDELAIKNLKGAEVKNLSLMLPGLDLELKELGVIESKAGKSIELKIARSSFSPSLLNLVSGKKMMFKANAPDVYFGGTMRLRNDSLHIEDFELSLEQNTKLNLKGYVYDVGGQNKLDVKLSPACFDLKEIQAVLVAKLPEQTSPQILCSDFSLRGGLNQLVLSGSINYNHTRLNVSAQLKQSLSKQWLVQLDLKSQLIDLMAFAPELKKELRMYQISMSSSITLSKDFSFQQIALKLKSDSIQSASLNIRNPDLSASYTPQKFSVWIESPEQNYKIRVETSGNILQTKNLQFNGEASINDLSQLVPNYKTGRLSTSFHGEILSKTDSLSAYLCLDKSLLVSTEGNKHTILRTEVEFQKAKKDYSFLVKNDRDSIIQLTFTDSLITWLKQTNKELETIPVFSFRSNLLIDSSFTEDFIGRKIQFELKELVIHSDHLGFYAHVNAPFISVSNNQVKDLDVVFNYANEKKELDLKIDHIINPYLNIDSLNSSVHFKSLKDFNYDLSGKLPGIQQDIRIGGDITLRKNQIGIHFDKNKSIKLGEQIWVCSGDSGLIIHTNSNRISGDLSLQNGEQKIQFLGKDEKAFLSIDSLHLGPLADFFVKGLQLDAELNLRTDYNSKNGEMAMTGKITDILVDSISLGYSSFDASSGPLSTQFNLQSKSSAWSVSVDAKNSNDITELELSIDQLNLAKLDSVLDLISNDFDLAGNIHGKIKAKNGESLKTEGMLHFENVLFRSKEYGAVLKIDEQRISMYDNQIKFNKFIIQDEQNNPLELNGSASLNEPNTIDLNIYSKQFAILNNQDPKAITKGKIDLETDLKIKGEFSKLGISGKVNVLKGGNVFHYHKSSVSLNGTDEVVSFVSFEEEKKKGIVRQKRLRKLPINWNVSMNIGSTEIYVLLDKTKQDYIKLTASGDLQLRKGKELMPDVFGSISSSQGKIYYDLPIVSDVEMKIETAKAQWNGDLKDPLINFKGVETFRVTPNEMSPEFQNKKNRVPVNVTALVNNKTLKKFEINFDISSGNAEVQNMLSSLPAETKESYAINMLVFGKVNNDSKGGTSGMSAVVGKLNEISRRNIKNADLSFHVENNSGDDLDGNQTANKIGYNFSKGFYKEKFKVSVGGNFDVGTSTTPAKSTPLGTIQLEYQLKEEPNITLQLKRENSYRGPIEGQVDESGIILNYTKKFKNLFKITKTKQTATGGGTD